MRITLLLCLFTVFSAQADTCDFYRKNAPWMYEHVCKNRTSRTKIAGAASTFNSSFNLNAASLPSEPTAYGIETIVSEIRGGDGHIGATFGLVKGFKKFGAALSTSGQNTFYGDDVLLRLSNRATSNSFKETDPAKGSISNLNLGTAFRLFGRNSGPSLQLGVSARYNKITDSWGGGPALMFGVNAFSFGVGYTHERISNLLPAVNFMTYQVSVLLWIFEFEATVLTDNINGLKPIPIATGTARIGRLMLTAAARRVGLPNAPAENQFHYAAQFLFSKHFSAGFLFNYIPGANSVGVQIFL